MDKLFLDLAEYASEPAMQIVIAIVFVTGMVRGFSGFGTGMLIGPPTAALYSPQLALAMIVLMDSLPTLPLALSARKDVRWREVIPIVAGFIVLVPLGIWLLKAGDPTTLRWFISISILLAVIILWSGWTYTGPRGPAVSAGFGGVGGFMAGAASLPGPPILLYWMASATKAIEVRANMIWYLFVTDMIMIVGFTLSGVMTLEAVLRAILCVVPYLFGIWIGSLFFAAASEKTYRMIAFVMILIAAITSLPVLDSVLR